MELKIIKNRKDYEEAIKVLDDLIDLDPDPGTSEGNRLEVLATIVESYEKERFPIKKPNPIEAIKIRMDDLGFRQQDLIPFIGSKSKVSEVLSGKRSLTLQMIKGLHKGLHIPAEILLQDNSRIEKEDLEIEWERFPIKEMVKRDWIITQIRNVKEHAAELMKEFLSPLDGQKSTEAFFKGSFHNRIKESIDPYAIWSWVAQVKIRGEKEATRVNYVKGTINNSFLKKLAFLSCSDEGPLLAKEFLAKNGITLIVESSLPKTRVDGCSALLNNGNPVVGMSLRYDRIDNFWFTLFHELIHVSKHLNNTNEGFVDDLKVKSSGDPIEKEADFLAGMALVPDGSWKSSNAYLERTSEAVVEYARKINVHPGIVAGKIQHEEDNFRILTNLLGRNKVRRLFPETKWG